MTLMIGNVLKPLQDASEGILAPYQAIGREPSGFPLLPTESAPDQFDLTSGATKVLAQVCPVPPPEPEGLPGSGQS